MRIGFAQTNGPATETQRRSAPAATNSGFADVLTSVARHDSETGPEPELSSATYRLFAAIAAERGDTTHATHFRERAAQAREAGVPLHPSGVLAENGRWDYTPAAALVPETGRFDSRSGQGVLRFTSYGPADPKAGGASDPVAEPLDSKRETADAIDRVPDRVRRSSALLGTSRDAAPTQSVSVEAWWEALHRVG